MGRVLGSDALPLGGLSAKSFELSLHKPTKCSLTVLAFLNNLSDIARVNGIGVDLFARSISKNGTTLNPWLPSCFGYTANECAAHFLVRELRPRARWSNSDDN